MRQFRPNTQVRDLPPPDRRTERAEWLEIQSALASSQSRELRYDFSSKKSEKRSKRKRNTKLTLDFSEEHTGMGGVSVPYEELQEEGEASTGGATDQGIEEDPIVWTMGDPPLSDVDLEQVFEMERSLQGDSKKVKLPVAEVPQSGPTHCQSQEGRTLFRAGAYENGLPRGLFKARESLLHRLPPQWDAEYFHQHGIVRPRMAIQDEDSRWQNHLEVTEASVNGLGEEDEEEESRWYLPSSIREAFENHPNEQERFDRGRSKRDITPAYARSASHQLPTPSHRQSPAWPLTTPSSEGSWSNPRPFGSPSQSHDRRDAYIGSQPPMILQRPQGLPSGSQPRHLPPWARRHTAVRNAFDALSEVNDD